MESLNQKLNIGHVSPINGDITEKEANIATEKLKMEAEDKAGELEEKKEDAEFFNETNLMVDSYQSQVNNLSTLERATKENLINAIDKDLEIIETKIDARGIENNEELTKSLNKLRSIKILFENSL